MKTSFMNISEFQDNMERGKLLNLEDNAKWTENMTSD